MCIIFTIPLYRRLHSSPASIRCWHLLCYRLIAFQAELAQNAPAARADPECVRGGWVPNTGDSHGLIFAWHSEQRRALQLSSSGLRSTSCGAVALSVCDVMRGGDNLAFVLYTLHLPLWCHCCVAHMSVHSIRYIYTCGRFAGESPGGCIDLPCCEQAYKK